MSINSGTSLDMETIRDAPFSGSGQENGPYYFVKKPDLPLNVNPATPQHPHFQEDALTLDDSPENLYEDVLELLNRVRKPSQASWSRDERIIKITKILIF
jgi:hypothetical protein